MLRGASDVNLGDRRISTGEAGEGERERVGERLLRAPVIKDGTGTSKCAIAPEVVASCDMFGVGGSRLTLGIGDEVGAGATEEGRAKGSDEVETALMATGIAGAFEESPAGIDTISCACIAVSAYDFLGSTTCIPASTYDLGAVGAGGVMGAGGSASTSMT